MYVIFRRDYWGAGKHASEALGMTELPEVSPEERERKASVQS